MGRSAGRPPYSAPFAGAHSAEYGSFVRINLTPRYKDGPERSGGPSFRAACWVTLTLTQPTKTEDHPALTKRPQRRPTNRNSLSFQRARNGNDWVLAHPQLLRECAEDLAEVEAMIAAGESDVAVGELRWLLGQSGELLPVHFLLGKLAVEADHDFTLGRGHFGAGYQLGLQAWRQAGQPMPVPPLHPANRTWFDCGRGLAWCLYHLQKTVLAVEVVQQLCSLDPTDPLGLAGWLDEMQTAGREMISLGGLFSGPGDNRATRS
jgi:hypothetical protein